MFLVNSRQGFFCCGRSQRPAPSRQQPTRRCESFCWGLEARSWQLTPSSHIANLRLLVCRVPSRGLTRSPWCAYTNPPVSVSGTVWHAMILDVFLGSGLSGISQALRQGISRAFGSGHDPRSRICLRAILAPGTEIQ